jgi:hypothetical protein
MKQMLPLALALTAGLASLSQGDPFRGVSVSRDLTIIPLAVIRQAATPPAAPVPLREGQPVIVVGEITSAPKRVAGVREERKMQVGIGPAKLDYTLHIGEAEMLDVYGKKLGTDDLVDKMWIRATGTVMDDPRRVKVTKLQIVGKDLPSLQQSAFYRTGYDQGYVMAVAGSRQVIPAPAGTTVLTAAPLVIVGKVADDTGPLENTRKIQVDASGNTWTADVPKDTPIFDTKGQKISVHEIAKGQWVRLHGWQTDDLRLRSARIENVGADEAFRTSAYFREGAPMGYVERLPGTGVRFNPLRISGVVTAVSEPDGTITVRVDGGQERLFPAETATFYVENRPVDAKSLRAGQRVTVQGNEIIF